LADGYRVAGKLQGFVGCVAGIDAHVAIDAAAHPAADRVGDGLRAVWRQFVGIVSRHAAQAERARFARAGVFPLPAIAAGIALALPRCGRVCFGIFAGISHFKERLRLNQRLRRALQGNVDAVLRIEVAPGQFAIGARLAIQLHDHIARALQRAGVDSA
jgi:hypothetical protein